MRNTLLVAASIVVGALLLGAAPDFVTRVEFDRLRERVSELERDVDRLREASQPEVRDGFSARTEDKGYWLVQGVRFHNDQNGFMWASGVLRYNGHTFWRRAAVQLTAYDARGRGTSELIKLDDLAPGTSRWFRDVQYGKEPADAVVSIEIKFVRNRSIDLDDH